MKIFKTKKDLQQYIGSIESQNRKIAFVPTMGALHSGHLSLIEYVKPLSDVTICSIFVNPTQFNDPKDLEKYPRPIEKDIELLERVSCDILFLPSVQEMYPENDPHWLIDLGDLDKIWEGEHRPGHFQGVAQIVFKLFGLVKPDLACFGQKDFQQVMVIEKMVETTNSPVKILICPTVRNEYGLALSSRNARLSSEGLHTATILYQALKHVKDHFKEKDIVILEQEARQIISERPEVRLEYLAVCETTTLQQTQYINPEKQYVVLLAAWLEDVRLIDNMLLNDTV